MPDVPASLGLGDTPTTLSQLQIFTLIRLIKISITGLQEIFSLSHFEVIRRPPTLGNVAKWRNDNQSSLLLRDES